MVIRSPKWFRKIFDFEFVTGKDLYPEVQLQQNLLDDLLRRTSKDFSNKKIC